MSTKGMLPPRLELNTAKNLNMCYGCGPENPIGLHLHFTWDGQTAQAEFTPDENHQGWPGILHGGVMSSLLDEAMGYVTYFKGLECVTAKFEMRIRCRAPLRETLLISAQLVEESKRLVKVGGLLAFRDGTPVAEGTGLMYVASRK